MPEPTWHQALSVPCWCGEQHDPAEAFVLNGDIGRCEFCLVADAPTDQFHPTYHDEGSPMRACDDCIGADNDASTEADLGPNIGRGSDDA